MKISTNRNSNIILPCPMNLLAQPTYNINLKDRSSIG